jgi:hypothetical protein
MQRDAIDRVRLVGEEVDVAPGHAAPHETRQAQERRESCGPAAPAQVDRDGVGENEQGGSR